MTEAINKNTFFKCFYSVLCILFILRIRNNLIFGIYLKLYCVLAWISLSFSPPSLLSTPDFVDPALKFFLAILLLSFQISCKLAVMSCVHKSKIVYKFNVIKRCRTLLSYDNNGSNVVFDSLTAIQFLIDIGRNLSPNIFS